jgi:hypothetical protein
MEFFSCSARRSIGERCLVRLSMLALSYHCLRYDYPCCFERCETFLAACPPAFGTGVFWWIFPLHCHVAVAAHVSAPKPPPTTFWTCIEVDVGTESAPSFLQISSTRRAFKFGLHSVESQSQFHPEQLVKSCFLPHLSQYF